MVHVSWLKEFPRKTVLLFIKHTFELVTWQLCESRAVGMFVSPNVAVVTGER